MANTDTPHGFDPVGSIRGPFPKGADPTTTAFFMGDLVQAANGGYVDPAAAGDTSLVGSSVGYMATTATQGDDLMVYDDPDQHFRAQTVTGTAPTVTIIGNQCNHVAGTGSSVTLLSGHELDISTTDATTGFGIILLDFVSQEDNDATLAHAEMICMIHETLHARAASTGV